MRLWPLLAALWPMAAGAEITSARYLEPTDVYGHGAIEGGEYAKLELTAGSRRMIVSYPNAVFEDTAPRIVDFEGDGVPEVVTVVSDFDLGAAIVIWGDAGAGQIAPLNNLEHIGQRHRWLSIAGIADLDGDGLMEIAYVDRPHLAKALRVIEVSFDRNGLVIRDEAVALGLTNHRLGAPMIEGGIFDCGQGPEILTADADWRRVMGTRLVGSALQSRDLGPYDGPASVTCP